MEAAKALTIFVLLHGVSAHNFDPWIAELLMLNGQSSPCQTNMVGQAWKENELDVVEDAPPEQAKVFFGDRELKNIGEELTPTIVQDCPKVSWTSQKGHYYTVLMIDPDAPSREQPSKREWYHFGVVNVQDNDISRGDVITDYVGAGPPKGTGLHRYVILVYQQSAKIDASKEQKIGMTGDKRDSRKARVIAKDLNLGKPIAGACFQAEWDDYVPELYKKLF